MIKADVYAGDLGLQGARSQADVNLVLVIEAAACPGVLARIDNVLLQTNTAPHSVQLRTLSAETVSVRIVQTQVADDIVRRVVTKLRQLFIVNQVRVERLVRLEDA
jgi:hypothetical protein